MSLSNSIIVLNTISTISLAHTIGYVLFELTFIKYYHSVYKREIRENYLINFYHLRYQNDIGKQSLSLGYMEKIIPCNRQKYRNSKTANNIRNKHNRMVLAEGLEPMDTQGIE